MQYQYVHNYRILSPCTNNYMYLKWIKIQPQRGQTRRRMGPWCLCGREKELDQRVLWWQGPIFLEEGLKKLDANWNRMCECCQGNPLNAMKQPFKFSHSCRCRRGRGCSGWGTWLADTFHQHEICVLHFLLVGFGWKWDERSTWLAHRVIKGALFWDHSLSTPSPRAIAYLLNLVYKQPKSVLAAVVLSAGFFGMLTRNSSTHVSCYWGCVEQQVCFLSTFIFPAKIS